MQIKSPAKDFFTGLYWLLAAIGLESELLKYHDISPCIKKIIVKRNKSFYYKEL